jgi:hypothetical protein
LSADGAFAILREISQDTNVKLRQVAHRIVDTWAVSGPRADFDAASGLLLAVREQLRPQGPRSP